MARRMTFAAALVAILCALGAAPPAGAQTETKPLAKEQIEQMMAPIALYPDALLAQVLMAATYPLEIVSAARWSKANPKVTGAALEEAMSKQSWDPSVKALTAVPQVLQMMSDRLEWTQQLGDAFLAQKDDVLAAVQSLRARAKAAGKLDTTKEQKVSVESVPASAATGGQSEVIVIQSPQPDVVHVPSYNPVAAYGGWPYPSYPPMTWYPPGYVASNLVSFGLGVAVGAAVWGNCDWGRGDVNINTSRYNNFNRANINSGNWKHNELHRKGVPYRDRKVAEQFNRGGRSDAAARERFRGRQEAARPGADRPGGDRPGADRPGRDRPGANRPGGDRPGARPTARPGGPDRGARPAARTERPGANRPHSGGQTQRSGMQQPRATHGIGQGNQVRQNSARGATSRQQSHATRGPSRSASAPSRSAPSRGGRR